LFAWIIGWDLILEYAVGAATVANGWSGYFQSVLLKLGIAVPVALSGAPHKYDQGHILPNVVGAYSRSEVNPKVLENQDPEQAKDQGSKPFSVTQKVVDSKGKPATWADGSEQPVKGIYWVFSIKEQGI